jgi:hypothetical protein
MYLMLAGLLLLMVLGGLLVFARPAHVSGNGEPA